MLPVVKLASAGRWCVIGCCVYTCHHIRKAQLSIRKDLDYYEFKNTIINKTPVLLDYFLIFHFDAKISLLPIGILDTAWLFHLMLNVTLPDANEDAHQKEQSEHTSDDLHDFNVADHLGHLINNVRCQ